MLTNYYVYHFGCLIVRSNLDNFWRVSPNKGEVIEIAVKSYNGEIMFFSVFPNLFVRRIF